MSNEAFTHDVFLSHSAKDKAVVRPLAQRLRKDGLKVWFDEWVLKPGDSIPAKIEEGLEHLRVLVLCMSAHAFGSDWAQLEARSFRFREPPLPALHGALKTCVRWTSLRCPMKTSSCVGTLLAVHLLTTSAARLEANPFENWVQRVPGTRFLEDVAFGNDAFVAVGSSGQIFSSKNGADWAFRGVDSAYSFYGVTYGEGQFLAVGMFALDLDALRCHGFSTNGESWQVLWDTWQLNEIFGSVAYGNDAAVAVSYYNDRLYWATNFQGSGPYWTLVGSGSFAKVAFGGGRFFVVGPGGLIQTSVNGKDWEVANSGVTNTLLDVAYGNGTYVAVGLEGTILRSGDGITWIPCPSPTTNGLGRIAFGAGVFLAGGFTTSEAVSSTDGAVWQLHRPAIPDPSAGLTRYLTALTFGAGSFVALIRDYAPGCCVWSDSIYQSGSVQVELSGGYRADLNGFEVTARGGLEHAYTLQQSTNLTDWTDVLVFTNPGPTNIFTDTSASNTPHRFFRAVAP